MELHERAVSAGSRLGVSVAILIAILTVGCGGNGGGSGEATPTLDTPTLTPTALRPTATSTPMPTATPTASPSRPVEPSATATPTPRSSPSATPTPSGSPSPETCDVADPCPPGAFCELPVGVCAGDLGGGACTEIPSACFEEIAPVCGCDGLTYGSDCLRRGASVQKAHDEPCPAEECGDDCDCYATRTFAVSCPLECATCDSYWSCEDRRCIERCGPVPSNRCELFCFDNEPCAPQTYCAKPVGECAARGACRPRPEGCPDVLDPVCGCNGQTFSNECDAAQAGVAVAHRGPCEEEPTPTPSPAPCDVANPCPDRQFCELPAGVCASDVDAGTCVDVPDFCFDPETPECGCDGLTYGSNCLRRAARVQKSAAGPCPAEECRDRCDCYATRVFASTCPLLCPTCGSFWTCDDFRCIEHCGMIPPDLCPTLRAGNEECAASFLPPVARAAEAPRR